MKTKIILFSLFLLVSAVFLLPAIYFAQGDRVIDSVTVNTVAKNSITELQATIWEKIWDAITEFINFVNWFYVLVFIIITWLISDHAASINRAGWLSFWDRIPKVLQSLIIGFLLIPLFYWGFSYSGRHDVMSMLFSMLAGMVIYKIGIYKLLSWCSRKMGLKFISDIPEIKDTNIKPKPEAN